MTNRSTTSDRDRVLDHEYDGIREYDNPLPGWWVWLFVVTIVFSAGYYAYYQVGPGPTIIAQYEHEMHEAAERQATQVAGAGDVTDAALIALQKDQAAMEHAREIFRGRCAPCHGHDGQGVIGPNLTDEYWLHGGRPTEILHTITEGVPDKGMLAWKASLQPGELRAMAAFVASLKGTNPPNPKPPQGTKVSAATPPVAVVRQ